MEDEAPQSGNADRDTRVSLLLALWQFRDAIKAQFEASEAITPDLSDDAYRKLRAESRRLSGAFHHIQQEVPRVLDVTKGALSELYPAMVRDYTAVAAYCSTKAWNARPDLDNYGSPAGVDQAASTNHEWTGIYEFSVPELETKFPNIGMTPMDIHTHLEVLKSAIDEIGSEFTMSEKQEAQKKDADMNRESDVYNITGSNIGAVGRHAQASNFTQNAQTPSSDDFAELAKQLDELRASLKKNPDADNRDIEIGAVAEAAREAKQQNKSGVMAALRRAGGWTVKIAEELGVKLAAETIAAAIK